MTREDVIRIAQEAGLDIDAWEPLYEGGLTGFGVYECTHEELERFAALVASAEREACAKVCDAFAQKALEAQKIKDGDDLADIFLRHHASAHFQDAAAIRARGQA
jgi:hypothetical protein